MVFLYDCVGLGIVDVVVLVVDLFDVVDVGFVDCGGFIGDVCVVGVVVYF